MNVVVLHGTLSSDAVTRALPSGDRLVQLELTIREAGSPTASVPLAWIGAPARAASWLAGTELVVRGRVQRRFFRVGGTTSSRTEVVVEAAVPARQRARASALVRAASVVLADGSETDALELR